MYNLTQINFNKIKNIISVNDIVLTKYSQILILTEKH